MSSLTLARQFFVAGTVVFLAGMMAIGVWVTAEITDRVTRNTAVATALYVDGVISPLLATVDPDAPLTEGVRRALDEVTAETALGARISAIKLWRPDGVIAYSNRTALVGARFEPTDSLRTAFAGDVAAEFDDLHGGEDALERAEGRPLLEIYSPVREAWSGRVVWVAEFYEYADDLVGTLAAVRLRSWLVVAAVTAAMYAVLFGIVLRGSRLIDRQRAELERRIGELSDLLASNAELSEGLRSANARSAALNERYLRRVSADIHDGPAQLIALAALRLGAAPSAADGETGRIREALDAAMAELRAICRGLALPEIERMPLAGLLAAAVDAHRARTGTAVALRAPEADPPLGPSERICVFRFVQEGLSNAFRHAGGVGQAVAARLEGGRLVVTVEDAGPGFDPAAGRGDRLGLAGLRERVESLGGAFAVASSAAGTRLTLTLDTSEVAR